MRSISSLKKSLSVKETPETDQDSTAIGPDKARIIEEIRKTIYEVRDLPTLPTIAHEVCRLIGDPNSSMVDLVEVIEEDVPLSGRVLRIANSAYYGVPRKIDNLKMALVILGMNEINNLVTTISVLNLFPQQSGKTTFDLNAFWRHSAACAELSVGLFEGLGLPCPSSTYIAGLLHDVGKLVLNQYFPEYLLTCINYAEEHHITLAEAELKLIGVDHGHIGSWLSKRWNVPDEITKAIAQHHVRPSDTHPYDLPAVIDQADRLFYVMEGRSTEEAVELLGKDSAWEAWHANRGRSTPELIKLLYERIERSLKLVKIID